MAFVIKKGKQSKPMKDKCDHCDSEIGFYNSDIITKPSVRYPSALMIEYVKCPNCKKMTQVGNYLKSMDDVGNYMSITTKEDWRDYYEQIRME